MSASCSNGNIKYPIGRSIFALNLLLKLFPATVANHANWKSKVSPTFLKECLYHMLVKFEQNRRPMVQTTKKIELFDKNKMFLKLFLTKR